MDYRSAYRALYKGYTDSEKRRFWILLSKGSREEYLRIESFLSDLTVLDRSFIELLKPGPQEQRP